MHFVAGEFGKIEDGEVSAAAVGEGGEDFLGAAVADLAFDGDGGAVHEDAAGEIHSRSLNDGLGGGDFGQVEFDEEGWFSFGGRLVDLPLFIGGLLEGVDVGVFKRSGIFGDFLFQEVGFDRSPFFEGDFAGFGAIGGYGGDDHVGIL